MDRSRLPSPSRSFRALVVVAAVLVGVLWVVVKHPLEGRVEYELTAHHGIHRYDFLALIPPAAALWWWFRTR
jgi:hypothetical protein